MDVEAQLVIGRVVDVVLPEGDIAHSQIVKVPLIGCFKAVHGDVRFLVELSGNAPGEAVQLHAVQLGPGQGFRQEAEEVADAHGGLQHRPRLKLHVLHRLIHGLDNGGAGVVGVEHRTAGGIVLLGGQQLFQLGVFLGPLRVVRVERLGNTAPAHVAGQNLLLLGCGKTALPLDLLQGADGRHIVLIFGFLTARTQVIVGDVEIVPLLGRPGRWGFGRDNLPAVDFHLFRLGRGRLCKAVMGRGTGLRRFLLPEPVGYLSGDVFLVGDRVLHGFPHIGDGG